MNLRKMQKRRKIILGVALISMIALPACVSTLFFPAKSAEQAADKVIDNIWPDVKKP